jgi:hypothetical protein
MITKRRPKKKAVTIRVPAKALRASFKRAAKDVKAAAEVKPAVVVVDDVGAPLATVPVPPSTFRRLVGYFTK